MPAENANSTTSHLSVAMTTGDEQFQTTVEGTLAPKSTSDAEFYFKCAGVLTGVVGTAANGLILYAMVASQQHKKQILIFNQNVFDLCSSLLLAITYSLRLCNIYLTGSLGYWLCCCCCYFLG